MMQDKTLIWRQKTTAIQNSKQ